MPGYSIARRRSRAAARTPAHTPGQDPTPASLIPLHLRLLRHQTEWGAPSQGVARYFSEPGWQTYAEYLRTNILHLLSLRDQGPSAGQPVFMLAADTGSAAGYEAMWTLVTPIPIRAPNTSHTLKPVLPVSTAAAALYSESRNMALA